MNTNQGVIDAEFKIVKGEVNFILQEKRISTMDIFVGAYSFLRAKIG